MPVDEKHSMRFCGRCGKVIRSNRKGTMTAWIFGGSVCDCGSEAKAYSSQPELSLSSREIQQKSPGPAIASTASTPVAPDLGPHFEILDFLGEGGMGSVYKIREVETRKVYAAKVLKDYLASDANAIKRFELEVRAASELTHTNLVFVYGAYRTASGAPYMVMNFVDGTSLGEFLKFQKIFPYKRALPIFTQVADAITHAHRKSIVHRDLKPNNILIYQHESQRDAVRVVDFGIAKILNQDIKTTNGITQTGELFGSPWYMSPEQCSGDELDARSDIYSLGCVMYHTLYGQPPFNDGNAMKTMLAHIQTPPPIALVNKNRDVPKDLEKVVMRCLAKDPDMRYQTASALAEDLKAISVGRTISKGEFHSKFRFRHWRLIAIIASSVSVGAITAFCATLYFVRLSERKAHPVVQSTPTEAPAPKQLIDTYSLNDLMERAGTINSAKLKDGLKNAGVIEAKMVEHNGQGMRQVMFPASSMGVVCRYSGLDYQPIIARATRIVYLPADVPLTLCVLGPETGGLILETPSIFEKIDPTLFEGLEISSFHPSHLSQAPSPDTIKNLATILTTASKWTKLKMVTLTNFPPNLDEVFLALSQIKQLRLLALGKCHISSTKLPYQSVFSRLSELKLDQLDETSTANAIELLNGSPHLEKLRLKAVTLPDKQLAVLKSCPKLSSIVLQKCILSEDSLKSIAEIKSLRSLFIAFSKPNEEAVRHVLSQCPQLTRLTLSRNSYSAGEYEAIRKIDPRITFDELLI